MGKADKKKLGYVGKKPGERDSNSWYTPVKYLDSARIVLGDIDLDPFTSDLANKTVKAKHILTVDASAFGRSWGKHNSCWMNPPYGAGICGASINKFIEEFEAKSFKQGIVLTNSSTDTKWFKALASKSSAICFTDHRISFDSPDKKEKSSNTKGQCFFYFGKQKVKFVSEFRKYGLIMQNIKSKS